MDERRPKRLFPSRARMATLGAARRAGDEYGRPAEPRWTEVDWAAHTHDVLVEGRRIRYIDYGDAQAPAVVFVHGISGNKHNWLEQLPRVAADGRRALALDLPGFGESEMPAARITISELARLVDRWCEALGLGAVPLVGHSMGGFISAEVAIRHPARVERLVLVSAAGITHADLHRAPALVSGRLLAAVTTRQLVQIRQLVRRPRSRHLLLSFLYRHPTLINGALVDATVSGAGTDGFLPAFDAILRYDFRDRLAEIGCETLIVWGTDDMLTGVEDADEYERRIPSARKVVLEDTGHMIQQERPQAFNDCVADFLAQGAPVRAGETVAA